MRKPSMPPAGPPRDSQSSISTSQPTPIIVPKPNVKYSTVDSPPRSFATALDYISARQDQHPRIATDPRVMFSSCAPCLRGYERPDEVIIPHMTHQPRASFQSPRF